MSTSDFLMPSMYISLLGLGITCERQEGALDQLPTTTAGPDRVSFSHPDDPTDKSLLPSAAGSFAFGALHPTIVEGFHHIAHRGVVGEGHSRGRLRTHLLERDLDLEPVEVEDHVVLLVEGGDAH